jgi:hypothetical protein
MKAANDPRFLTKALKAEMSANKPIMRAII